MILWFKSKCLSKRASMSEQIYNSKEILWKKVYVVCEIETNLQ